MEKALNDETNALELMTLLGSGIVTISGVKSAEIAIKYKSVALKAFECGVAERSICLTELLTILKTHGADIAEKILNSEKIRSKCAEFYKKTKVDYWELYLDVLKNMVDKGDEKASSILQKYEAQEREIIRQKLRAESLGSAESNSYPFFSATGPKKIDSDEENEVVEDDSVAERSASAHNPAGGR